MPSRPQAVVAIPACNEAARIEACLAALAAQRDGYGAPLPAGSFDVLVFANNCADETETTVRAFADVCPHPVVVVSERLPPERANAGWARKRAMDLAAERLDAHRPESLILTTDADSCVASTWFAETILAMTGVDCVAGYIDAFPAEIMRLGPAFVRRGRLEDRYLRLMAETYALCDPRLHDPWPNHRVSSGASLAVTVAAYRAVGGLPPQALGEDAAFTRALEAAGFLVRRPMTVTVGTSCRFDGRAMGGAADTMRLRHAIVETPCDDEIEPASMVVRRALWRGLLRQAREVGVPATGAWARRLGFDLPRWRQLIDVYRGRPFEALWNEIAATSPTLARRRPLSPKDLPDQIRRAETLLARLRHWSSGHRSTDRAGILHRRGARGETAAPAPNAGTDLSPALP